MSHPLQKSSDGLPTPGSVISAAYERLIARNLKNVKLPIWANERRFSPSQLPAFRYEVRARQGDAVGRLVDLGLLGTLVGGGMGAVEGYDKLRKTRKQIDDAASQEEVISEIPVATKQADTLLESFGNIVSGIGRKVRETQYLDPTRAVHWRDVGLAGLPPGIVYPLASVAAATGLATGQNMVDNYTDEQRADMLAERKRRLEAEFQALLAPPSKAASALDLHVDTAARLHLLREKMATGEGGVGPAGPQMVWGAWMAYALATAMAGMQLGRKLRQSRDPGRAEQKALETALMQQRALQRPAVHLTPVPVRPALPAAAVPSTSVPWKADPPDSQEDDVEAARIKKVALMGGLSEAADKTREAVGRGFKAVGNGIWDHTVGPAADRVESALVNNGKALQREYAEKLYGDATGAVKQVWGGLKDVVGEGYDAAKPYIQGAWNTAKPYITSLWDKAKTMAPGLATLANGWANATRPSPGAVSDMNNMIASSPTAPFNAWTNYQSKFKQPTLDPTTGRLKDVTDLERLSSQQAG